jgi:hypothetical protein
VEVIALKLLTVSETASMLGLSAQTVRSIPHSVLPHSRTHGGQRRYKIEEVEQYSKSCEVGSASSVCPNCGVSYNLETSKNATIELRSGCIVLNLPSIQLWSKAAATITQINKVLDFDRDGYITIDTNDGEEYVNPYGIGELIGIPEAEIQAEMAKVESVTIIK